MKFRIFTAAVLSLSPLALVSALADVERSVDYKEYGHDYAMTMTVSSTGVSFLEREKGAKDKTAQDKAELRAIRVNLGAADVAPFEQIGTKFLEQAKKAQETKPNQFTTPIGKIGPIEYKINWDGSSAWLTGNGFLRPAEVERMLGLIKQLPEAKAELAKSPAATTAATPPK
jgi:hypothetical protein